MPTAVAAVPAVVAVVPRVAGAVPAVVPAVVVVPAAACIRTSPSHSCSHTRLLDIQDIYVIFKNCSRNVISSCSDKSNGEASDKSEGEAIVEEEIIEATQQANTSSQPKLEDKE